MPSRRTLLSALLLPLLSICAGCLSSKPPVEPRWFTPPVPARATAESVALGAVTAAPHLGEPMTWRLSPVEVAYDETNRWVATPAELLAAAAAQCLRVDGSAPRRLQLHLLTCEAIRGDRTTVHVSFRARLERGGDQPLLQTEFDDTQSCPDDSPESIAAATGTALGRTLTALATWLSLN